MENIKLLKRYYLRGIMFILMSKVAFIEWIESILEEKNMSKADLAKASGISAPQISRIMRSEQNPGIDSILGLAKALGRSPCEVFSRVAGINYVEKSEEISTLSGLFFRLSDDGKKDLMNYAEYIYHRES